MPVEICAATRLPRSMSCVNTEPPRPNGESLASRMASSSSFTLKIIDTGPKNSWW